MLSPRVVVPAALAFAALACAHDTTPVTAALAADRDRGAARDDASYVTITPHVSVSRNADTRNADTTEQARAALDPNADVMAEILAIPPGG